MEPMLHKNMLQKYTYMYFSQNQLTEIFPTCVYKKLKNSVVTEHYRQEDNSPDLYTENPMLKFQPRNQLCHLHDSSQSLPVKSQESNVPLTRPRHFLPQPFKLIIQYPHIIQNYLICII
jgi:hypothetical protein